jgi:transcriptional regulator with XRE-family HTH domain
MDFLSPAQCRAARGLLDWSQPDLAKKCGMHVQTICAFEKEAGTPTKKTLEKISSAFEDMGIEFTSDDGVRNKNLKTMTYRGQKGHQSFMSLVYKVAKEEGGEFCVSNVDERIFTERHGKGEDDAYMQKMAQIKDNFTFKILIQEGDTHLVASDYAEYRWIPKESFHQVPFYTFGNYLAFLIFDTQTIIHVINNPEIASAQRTQFNFVWKKAKKPSKNS